jgi:DedD protein
MSYLHDEIDDGPQHRSAYNSPSRELTLSTPAILGIFFGLALLCAVFFGFGYNMGSKSHQAPIVAANTSAAPAPTNFDSFKPAPGAPAVQTAPPVISAPSTATDAATDTSTATPAQPAPVVRNTPATPPPTASTRPEASATPASETGLTFIVQIAAVSHQEDADLLVAALKRKGYSVASRSEAQDKLIHIQVGPFPNKKDAEAMRQRLLADGYNAILK